MALTFRQVPFLLFDHRASRDLRPNTLILRIQPDEGISLEFGAKVPGEKFHLRSVAMDFSYAEAFAGAEAADGYERLIHDAMVGDATLFIRSDEVEQAWRIVDPYLQAWSEPGGGLHFYQAGTWGPHMADLLVERSGDEWRNPVVDLELSGGRQTHLAPVSGRAAVNGDRRPGRLGARGLRRPGGRRAGRAPGRRLLPLPLRGAARAAECYRPLAAQRTRAARSTGTTVDVYLGDERCVPPDDPDSNHRMITEALLDAVGPVRADHPMYRRRPPAAAAAAYQAAGRAARPASTSSTSGSAPTATRASLFPGLDGAGRRRPRAPVVANRDPNGINPHDRITLTLPASPGPAWSSSPWPGASKRDAFARMVAGEDLPAGPGRRRTTCCGWSTPTPLGDLTPDAAV